MAIKKFNYISSATLASASGSITLGSIPGTYQDLAIFFSMRHDSAGVTNEVCYFRVNNNTSAIYMYSNVWGDGSTVGISGTNHSANATEINYIAGCPGGSSGTGYFGLLELYIANYASTTYHKSIHGSSVIPRENTSSAARQNLVSGNIRTTSAITQVQLLASNGNFAAGTTAYLYGISS
jgi:hypothetical protein